jgi:hypothetical protein
LVFALLLSPFLSGRDLLDAPGALVAVRLFFVIVDNFKVPFLPGGFREHDFRPAARATDPII